MPNTYYRIVDQYSGGNQSNPYAIGYQNGDKFNVLDLGMVAADLIKQGGNGLSYLQNFEANPNVTGMGASGQVRVKGGQGSVTEGNLQQLGAQALKDLYGIDVNSLEARTSSSYQSAGSGSLGDLRPTVQSVNAQAFNPNAAPIGQVTPQNTGQTPQQITAGQQATQQNTNQATGQVQTASTTQTPQTAYRQNAVGDWIAVPQGTPGSVASIPTGGGSTPTQQVSTQNTPSQGTPQYQILDVASMGKYSPSQYERLGNGSVVLKQGVTPIEGTTKPYTGSGASGSGTGGTGTGGGGATPTEDPYVTQIKGILKSYGLDPTDNTVDPYTEFYTQYKKVYEDLGLTTVKSQIDTINKSITDLQNERDGKIQDIKDDPWIVEGVKNQRIQSISNRYDDKIKNLTSQFNLYDSVFTNGVQQAQFVAGKGLELHQDAQKMTQDLIFKAIDQAQKASDAISKGVDFGVIGVDPNTGSNIYGFIDKVKKTTTQIGSGSNNNNNINQSGSGIVTDGSGTSYDIASYATDPTHEAKVQNILNSIGKMTSVQQMDNYIKSIAPNSPVTGQMIANASQKYGVSWEAMMAIMQQDSTFGTQGAAVRSFNPGNVGNTEQATSTGNLVNYGSWQNGVDAVAKNLAGRKVDANALPKDEFGVNVSQLSPTDRSIWSSASSQDKAFAEQVANYDASITNITRGKSNKKALYTTLASIINPDYSEANYAAASAFRKNWQSGDYANRRIATNTALTHLAELQDAIDGLKNGNFKPYNTIANLVKANTGNPYVVAYQSAANKVASELAKAYKGNASPTELDAETERIVLDLNNSPVQANAAISTGVKLLSGALQVLKQTYEQNIGPLKQNILVPEAVSALQKLQNNGVQISSDVIPNILGNNDVQPSNILLQAINKYKNAPVGGSIYDNTARIKATKLANGSWQFVQQ